ncbi:NON-INTRINSIC ABC protein 6 [Rhynchospora pubera]|uniref:NON-INTRINSIC ABC protein 6 n=1 Tax=Rhynchospora pubera TaxID=906938 RepID=A0AAV8GQ89_9POAL|nr:NON-INTRINSIC ABC protein 6 [Rhynchospora pubera]
MSRCCYSSTSLLPPHHRLRLSPPLYSCSLPRKPLKALSVSASLSAPPSDKQLFVLELAEKLEDSLSLPLPPIQPLRDTSSQSLVSTPWPTRQSEPFRFTDISYLTKYPVVPAQIQTIPSSFPLNSSLPIQITLINGLLNPSLSRIPSLPAGVFVGSIKDVPQGPISEKISSAIASCSEFKEKDVFWDFNNVGAADVAVIFVPAGVKVLDPVHLMFCYSGSGKEEEMSMCNPRVLVVVEEDAEVSVVEEHFGFDGAGRYWANPVMEIFIGERGKVSHSYVQRQPLNAAHIKWTVARQEASSTYEHVEVSIGGLLSRHNLHIQQLGPETVTELSTFDLVSQSNQIQDLHSRLVLDYPKGYSRQLHKCIVCNSAGRAVFDGNIRVNRFAQNTDAGQQTRSLLLAPKALVTVKPNLQIIADDVKCAHGAAISDLDQNELFYFQARGLDLKTARNALVYYFGADVIRRIPFKPIRETAASEVKKLLSF